MASTTPVTDVMTSAVVTVSPDLSLTEAADVLSEKGIGAVPVVNADGELVGLLRDEDLLISEARLHLPTTIAILPGIEFTLPGQIKRYDEELKKAASSTVGDVMEREFESVAPSGSIEDVATLMHEHDVTHVPVVDGGKVVGIVARGDIVRFLAATT
jgi:CBS domain-containing protein